MKKLFKIFLIVITLAFTFETNAQERNTRAQTTARSAAASRTSATARTARSAAPARQTRSATGRYGTSPASRARSAAPARSARSATATRGTTTARSARSAAPARSAMTQRSATGRYGTSPAARTRSAAGRTSATARSARSSTAPRATARSATGSRGAPTRSNARSAAGGGIAGAVVANSPEQEEVIEETEEVIEPTEEVVEVVEEVIEPETETVAVAPAPTSANTARAAVGRGSVSGAVATTRSGAGEESVEVTVATTTTKTVADVAAQIANEATCKSEYNSCMAQFCKDSSNEVTGNCLCSASISQLNEKEKEAKKYIAGVNLVRAQISQISLAQEESVKTGKDFMQVLKEMTVKATAGTADQMTAADKIIQSINDVESSSIYYGSVNDMSMRKEGDALLKEAQKACASYIELCPASKEQIEKGFATLAGNDCRAYSKDLDNKIMKEKLTWQATLSEFSSKALKGNLDTTNKYNAQTCATELNKCMREDTKCGADLELCYTDALLEGKKSLCQNVLAQCQGANMPTVADERKRTEAQTDVVWKSFKKAALQRTQLSDQQCFEQINSCMSSKCGSKYENCTTQGGEEILTLTKMRENLQKNAGIQCGDSIKKCEGTNVWEIIVENAGLDQITCEKSSGTWTNKTCICPTGYILNDGACSVKPGYKECTGSGGEFIDSNNTCSCNAGFESVDYVCTECSAGTYKTSKSSNACIICEKGKYCTGATAAPVSCPQNITTASAGSKSASDCSISTACPAGSYLANNKCTTCAKGQYCTGGTSQPQNCPANSTTASTGGTSASSCSVKTACSAGQYLANGNCATCPANSSCAGGTAQPQACPAGQQSAAGSSSCGTIPGYADCINSGGSWVNNACSAPAGKYLSSGKAVLCEQGFYCTGGRASRATCPANTTTLSTGGTSSSACSVKTSCPSGQYLSNGACLACPAGSYCPAGATAPTRCQAGKYCPAGVSAASTCAANTYSQAGATSCTSCPTGQTSASGASSCTAIAGYAECTGSGGTWNGGTGTSSSGSSSPSRSAAPSATFHNTFSVNTIFEQATAESAYNAGGYTSGVACICPSGKFLSSGTCKSCPANASCSSNNFTCSSGYTKSGETCKKLSCSAGQYVNGTSCSSCPAGKYCTGGTAQPQSCPTGDTSVAGSSSCTPSANKKSCTSSGGKYESNGSCTCSLGNKSTYVCNSKEEARAYWCSSKSGSYNTVTKVCTHTVKAKNSSNNTKRASFPSGTKFNCRTGDKGPFGFSWITWIDGGCKLDNDEYLCARDSDNCYTPSWPANLK